jgi:hypothetical protein
LIYPWFFLRWDEGDEVVEFGIVGADIVGQRFGSECPPVDVAHLFESIDEVDGAEGIASMAGDELEEEVGLGGGGDK